MALFSDVQSWYEWLADLTLIPAKYDHILRVITSSFRALAFVPIAPVVLLLIYDFSLWLWRHAVARPRVTPIIRDANGAPDSTDTPVDEPENAPIDDSNEEPTSNSEHPPANGSKEKPASGLTEAPANDSAAIDQAPTESKEKME
ncbi:hypothetical protein VTK26DRAFT_266 [Humicola hyalothermophila]